MKRTWIAIFFMLLSACAAGGKTPPTESRGAADPSPGNASPTPRPTLANYGKAPELTNEVWLNTEHPLRLADLRGKVVLLEMWTFG